MYAGYGLLSDKRFIQELLGRPVRPWEFEDVVYGFRLKVLQRDELPQTVRSQTLEGFKIYGAVPDSEGRGRLKVLKLDLSIQEREAVRALNFDNDLYVPFETVNSSGISGSEPGVWAGVSVEVIVLSDIEVLRDGSKGRFVDGMTYSPYLNGEVDAMETARAIRTRFIQTTPEGQSSRREF